MMVFNNYGLDLNIDWSIFDPTKRGSMTNSLLPANVQQAISGNLQPLASQATTAVAQMTGVRPPGAVLRPDGTWGPPVAARPPSFFEQNKTAILIGGGILAVAVIALRR